MRDKQRSGREASLGDIAVAHVLENAESMVGHQSPRPPPVDPTQLHERSGGWEGDLRIMLRVILILDSRFRVFGIQEVLCSGEEGREVDGQLCVPRKKELWRRELSQLSGGLVRRSDEGRGDLS